MYKLEFKWNKEGEWLPTLLPIQGYADSYFRWREYSQRNPEHMYRMVFIGASK